MKIEPKIENRDKQFYAAIRKKLKEKEIPEILPPLIPELFQWFEQKNIKPYGAPFFNYINMDNQSIVEVGIPTSSSIKGDERVKAGLFPEGKYAVVKYMGPYNKLFEVHMAMEKWKDENHFKFIAPKVEFYPTDPVAEPNPEKWETIIINRIVEDVESEM